MNKKKPTLLQKLRKEARIVKSGGSREKIEAILKKVHKRKAIVWEEIEALTKIHTKLETQRSDIDSKTLFPTDDDITIEKVMGLNWEEVEGKLYDRIQDWFSTFKYLYQSCYHPETKQLCIKTQFYKDEPVETQIAEVIQFIPYIKEYIADELGLCRCIDIFEHTGPQHGCYSIYIQQNNKTILTRTYYRQLSILKEFDDVESCLRYVHQNHPYKLSESGTSGR